MPQNKQRTFNYKLCFDYNQTEVFFPDTPSRPNIVECKKSKTRKEIIIGMFALSLCIGFSKCALLAQDSISYRSVKLGDQEVIVQTTSFIASTAPITFINLHDDENTAVEAAEIFLQDFGGTLVQLKHTGARLIFFGVGDNKHGFDPNRMFTKTGIVTSLKKLGIYNIEASRIVSQLADTIIDHHLQKPKLLVAIHNNTDNRYSIRSYTQLKEEKKNALKLYINPQMDPDDFVFTTELRVYKHLVERKINAVLQNNRNVADEGSLSVYAAQKRIPYINVEAQIDHLDEQVRMLNELEEIFIWYGEGESTTAITK